MKYRFLNKPVKRVVVFFLILTVFASQRLITTALADQQPAGLPSVVDVLSGDGVSDSYEVKAQIVRYGEVIRPFAARPYDIVQSYTGESFPRMKLLRIVISDFIGKASSNLQAFGYTYPEVCKIYSANVNKTYSKWTITAAMRVTDAAGNKLYVAYADCGDEAAISPYYKAEKDFNAFETKYMDALTNAKPFDPFAGVTLSIYDRQTVEDLLYRDMAFASCSADATMVFKNYLQPIKRADFILLLMCTLERNYPDIFSVTRGSVNGRVAADAFTDTGLPYVNIARDFGIVSGYGSGLFKPAGYLTFSHASSIITNALRSLSEHGVYSGEIVDLNKIADYSGWDYSPTDFITKRHALEAVHQLYTLLGDSSATENRVIGIANAKQINRSVIKGAFVPAAAFTDANDSNVIASFMQPYPDFNKPGRHDVYIKLESGGKTKPITAVLNVYDGYGIVQREATRDPAGLSINDFLTQTSTNTVLLTNASYLKLSKPGCVYAAVSLDGDVSYCAVSYNDTTPPNAVSVTVQKKVGETVSPLELVTDIRDVSEVKCEFADEPPDMSKKGDYKVRLMLTDDYGNTAYITSKLIVEVPYATPPVFDYIPNRYFQIGQQPDFLSQVRLADGYDSSAVIKYDASDVDIKKPGRYLVKYAVTDGKGGKAEAGSYIIMTETSIEQVLSYANRVLDSIITDGMTQREQLRAVYDWSRTHISYIGTSDKTDTILGAYNAFKKGSGDCFTNYSATEVMLTQLGIKNVRVSRRPGYPTMHYWHFVNIGDGWYHFDTTPNGFHGNKVDEFLFTNERAEYLTENKIHNYDYDRSLYVGYDIK